MYSYNSNLKTQSNFAQCVTKKERLILSFLTPWAQETPSHNSPPAPKNRAATGDPLGHVGHAVAVRTLFKTCRRPIQDWRVAPCCF